MSPADPKLPLFQDADETVAAIHQGEVDAVVVMRRSKVRKSFCCRAPRSLIASWSSA
jgi:hypothetical protein